jgi:hypothetical protein
LSKRFSLARASRWFLGSGIQERSGGVARFYQSEIQKNKPVSSEITGYTASAYVYLFTITGDDACLNRARQTAAFLVDQAWDAGLRTFPYEHPSPSRESHHHAYFFDCGIIIRGLLAVWRQTREDRLLDIAHVAAQGMLTDFYNSEGRHAGKHASYHPILELPSKAPLPHTQLWSRSAGCYQLKSALAWLDVAELTADGPLKSAYFDLLASALATHAGFLPGATPHATMDRLHAYSYFLEALTPVLDRPDCAQAFSTALRSISASLREIAPSFVRSDVRAQLLRARIYGAGVIPLDPSGAASEAAALAGFQAESEDPRIDGGFSFGCRDGIPSPHINPVSTAFALQALEMWREYQAGNKPPCRHLLI